MKKRIMVGVYVIYFVRKFKNPFVTEITSLLVLGALLSYLVSVPSIVMNLKIAANLYNYILHAFYSTSFVVQSVFVLSCFFTLIFVVHILSQTVKFTWELKQRFA